MTVLPKPPAVFDDNPPLDDTFFKNARPAKPGEAARLRQALQNIVNAHDTGADLDSALADARSALHAAH